MRLIDFIALFFKVQTAQMEWREVIEMAPDHITDKQIEILYVAWNNKRKREKHLSM